LPKNLSCTTLMARFASSLQKKYLEDYAVQHGFDNIQHFSDDGYSGTNFVEVR